MPIAVQLAASPARRRVLFEHRHLVAVAGQVRSRGDATQASADNQSSLT
jgi:hypothetical protein